MAHAPGCPEHARRANHQAKNSIEPLGGLGLGYKVINPKKTMFVKKKKVSIVHAHASAHSSHPRRMC